MYRATRFRSYCKLHSKRKEVEKEKQFSLRIIQGRSVLDENRFVFNTLGVLLIGIFFYRCSQLHLSVE